jgi:dienelactone hydrolase
MADFWTELRVLGMAARLRVLRLAGRKVDPFPDTPPGLALSPSDRHFADYAEAPLRLKYDGSVGAVAWQRAAREKLIEISGFAVRRPVPEAVARREYTLAGGGQRLAVYLRVRDGLDIPINILFPTVETAEPLPVMICLQGTNSGAHLSWGDVRFPADIGKAERTHDIARQAASRGYLAVVVEQACFGERVERRIVPRSAAPCVDATMHAILLGRSLLGERCSDVSSVIDWLAAERAALGIDPSRIHVMGHSAGGSSALFAAALDDRISAVIASGCVGYIRDTIGRRRDDQGQNVIPGILCWMELDDVIRLVAPRAFLCAAGAEDPIWPAHGAEGVVAGSLDVFRELGAENKLRLVTHGGGHAFRPDIVWREFTDLLNADIRA